MRSSAAMSRQQRRWYVYDNSIQTYAFPISASGVLFIDQKISPNWLRGCAELGFRNSQRKGRQRPNRERNHQQPNAVPARSAGQFSSPESLPVDFRANSRDVRARERPDE